MTRNQDSSVTFIIAPVFRSFFLAQFFFDFKTLTFCAIFNNSVIEILSFISTFIQKKKRLIMGQFDVKVKWGKEKYEVTANTEEAPEMFKAQLFALTNVPLGWN